MKWTRNIYLYFVITRLLKQKFQNSVIVKIDLRFLIFKGDYENIYVLNYETVHMNTFRIFLLELQNTTLFPYVKTAKPYPKSK